MTLPLDQRIVEDPAIRGGKPCIRGHRISVSDIVSWHELLGKGVDEIASEYDLSVVDIYVALAYYYANQEAIDLSISQSDQFIQDLKNKVPSKLKEKMGG